jgi:hypothetical protein
MTDELVAELRAARPGYPPGDLCMRAADELERLKREIVFYREVVEEMAGRAREQLVRIEANMAYWKNSPNSVSISNAETEAS